MASAVDRLNALNPQLAKLEQIPVRPDISAAAKAPVEGEARTYQQLVDDAQGVRLGLVFEKLTDEPDAENDLWMLERQQIALMYRTKGRTHAPARDELLTDFTRIIERYKRKADLYPGGNGQLTAHDRAQIARVCNEYPVFVEALLRRHTKSAEIERNSNSLVWDKLDKRMYPKFVRQYFVYHDEDDKYKDPWTEGFVKFCLRSPGASGIDAPEWIKVFVEYPNETDALMKATLDKRIGAVSPDMLSLRPQADGSLAVSIKIQGVWERVQGTKKQSVALRNLVDTKATPHSLPKQDIYSKMRAKRSGYEDVEVFQEGILNWDSIQLGSFNPTTHQIDQVDVNQPDWLLKLPPWRVVDEAQLQQRFAGQVRWPYSGTRFALAVCATRETADLNIPNNHGFFEVVAEVEPGKFVILPFGFQPPTLPDSDIDKLCFLQSTQPGMLHYPDESDYLSQRQKFSEFFAIDGAEFQVLQKHLAHFVEKARAGQEVFQPTGNNCARHVQKVYDTVIGQRFYKPFEEFVESLFPDREVHEEIKVIRKELDDEALSVLSKEVAEHLIAGKDQAKMASLLHLCINTLADVLKINGTPIAAYKVTEAEALQKIQALYAENPAGADAILTNDLQKLITLCF